MNIKKVTSASPKRIAVPKTVTEQIDRLKAINKEPLELLIEVFELDPEL